MYNENGIRDKVKKYRKDRNLNQTQFAELVGIARTQITQLESGSRKPTLNIIRRIAEATDTPLSFWLEDSEINEIAVYEGLDVIIDKMLQDGLIDEEGNFDNKLDLLLLTMLKQEIKLKIYKNKLD